MLGVAVTLPFTSFGTRHEPKQTCPHPYSKSMEPIFLPDSSTNLTLGAGPLSASRSKVYRLPPTPLTSAWKPMTCPAR